MQHCVLCVYSDQEDAKASSNVFSWFTAAFCTSNIGGPIGRSCSNPGRSSCLKTWMQWRYSRRTQLCHSWKPKESETMLWNRENLHFLVTINPWLWDFQLVSDLMFYYLDIGSVCACNLKSFRFHIRSSGLFRFPKYFFVLWQCEFTWFTAFYSYY